MTRAAAPIDAASRDIADIDATIERWTACGVLAADIARDMRSRGLRVRCETWADVRNAMIAYAEIVASAMRLAA